MRMGNQRQAFTKTTGAPSKWHQKKFGMNQTPNENEESTSSMSSQYLYSLLKTLWMIGCVTLGLYLSQFFR